MKKKICGWIAFLCFVRLWGLAGMSDLDMIGGAELFARVKGPMALMLISLKIGGII